MLETTVLTYKIKALDQMISNVYSRSIILVNIHSHILYYIKEKFKMVATFKELTFTEAKNKLLKQFKKKVSNRCHKIGQ